ncbi:unnamed protein product, partial [Prorocentrum cordatum]
ERCAEVTYRTRLCTSDAQCMLRHPGRYEGQKRFCNTTTSLCEVLAEKRSDGHHIEGPKHVRHPQLVGARDEQVDGDAPDGRTACSASTPPTSGGLMSWRAVGKRARSSARGC